MTHIWKAAEKRERIAKRQKNRCYWCGEQMSRQHLHARQCTLDHIKPKSKGGGGNVENLVAACRTCNESRGSTGFSDFHKREVRNG